VPVENGRYLAEHIPGAALIVYPETGHIPEVERVDEFNRDLIAFLEA
jgi:pimeloyl-ACP methyl ester carboxylesterase